MTDLAPGKSFWKNVASAVTAFKKENCAGCYPQQPNAGKNKFQKNRGTYTRDRERV